MEIVLTDFPYRGEWWTFHYVFGGKQKTLSLGTYPLITLRAAPTKHDEMHQQLANGVGPGAVRTATKAAQRGDTDGFEVVAREWFEKFKPKRAHSRSARIIHRLEGDIFPWLGARPIGDITASELLIVIRRIEARDALETAHRALQNCAQVFRTT